MALRPWQSTQAAPSPLCWMGSMVLATSRGRRRPVRRAGACSGVTAGPAQPSRAALRISGCRSGRLTGTSIGCLGWLSALRGGPASCSVVQASSARRFRIIDGLSVRRRTSRCSRYLAVMMSLGSVAFRPSRSRACCAKLRKSKIQGFFRMKPRPMTNLGSIGGAPDPTTVPEVATGMNKLSTDQGYS